MQRGSRTIQLADEICRREHYDIVLDRLIEKTSDSAWKRDNSTSASPITLWQIIEDREHILSQLIESLQNEEYMPAPSYQTNLITDQKERVIYQLHWLDKIVQMVLAGILNQSLEHTWSDRLFSFRKGRSSRALLSQCAAFIREHPQAYFFHCDISSYGESIDQRTLAQKVYAQIGPQSSYIEKLLNECIGPLYQISEQPEKRRLRDGIATGIPLTPFFENIYLAELDNILEKEQGLFYGRYGDDIILLHTEKDQLNHSIRSLQAHIGDLKLTVQNEKTAQGQLEVSHKGIDYLGVRLLEDGTTVLPSKKLQRLKRKVTSICQHTYAKCHSKNNREALIGYLIQNVNHFLLETRLIPYLDYLGMQEYNDAELKKLDTWIAKQILRPIFGSTHDRVFRYVSRKTLVSKGLLSLQNVRHHRIRRYRDAS